MSNDDDTIEGLERRIAALKADMAEQAKAREASPAPSPFPGLPPKTGNVARALHFAATELPDMPAEQRHAKVREAIAHRGIRFDGMGRMTTDPAVLGPMGLHALAALNHKEIEENEIAFNKILGGGKYEWKPEPEPSELDRAIRSLL